MRQLEKFENSFIENPSLAVIDFESKLVQNERLYLRINLMEAMFCKSPHYIELIKLDERVTSRAFRFNVYNVFCTLFNETTIGVFFDISKERTISGLFKAMIFLLNASAVKKYYPIKCTILEYIVQEMLVHEYTRDLKAGWIAMRPKLLECFDVKDFDEYFKIKDETFINGKANVVIH